MTRGASKGERLSLAQAAFVVARRDFFAILISRSFLFFLLGPLFPLGVSAIAGGVGAQVESQTAAPEIGVAMASADVDAMIAARNRLSRSLGGGLPQMTVLRRLGPGETFDASGALDKQRANLAAVLTGTPARPVLTATPRQLKWWRGPVGLIASQARGQPAAVPEVVTRAVAASGASDQRARMRTAQAGQLLLFLLTMLLAGMVLSNLVEEKANKVIEVLAAAIPMEAVFVGKLFAMLAVSLVGITVWGGVIGAFAVAAGSGALGGTVVDFSQMPQPGVGWPMFIALGITYFSVSYLLLGSVFLTIGSLATTVREVQTLSMPVTMMQVMLFFVATLAMADPDGWIGWAAALFPFSSTYVMLARGALSSTLWPHLLALAWQISWVAITVRIGTRLFRKRVMQSGPRREKRGWFRRRAASRVSPI